MASKGLVLPGNSIVAIRRKRDADRVGYRLMMFTIAPDQTFLATLLASARQSHRRCRRAPARHDASRVARRRNGTYELSDHRAALISIHGISVGIYFLRRGDTKAGSMRHRPVVGSFRSCPRNVAPTREETSGRRNVTPFRPPNPTASRAHAIDSEFISGNRDITPVALRQYRARLAIATSRASLSVL